jgi:ABC-type glycerol-3-phosphate transport system substrate-binding protein
MHSDYTPPDGSSHKDSWLMDWIEEKANIEWEELVVPAYGDAGTKFNLMMASGDIPDFVEMGFTRHDMRRYADEGAFYDLTDYMLNSAQIRKLYSDVQLNAMRSLDNRIYVIDTLPINSDIDMVFLRTDLMERAGVTQVPKTLDDFVAVLRAVKAYNPNSLPYVTRQLVFQAWFMFHPFNTGVAGWRYFPERGVVANYWEGDNILKAAEFARMLYAEGLLDREFLTNTNGPIVNQKRLRDDTVLWAQNRGGIGGRISAFAEDGRSGARLIPVITPVAEGVGINAYHTMNSLLGSYNIAISAQSKNTAAVWRLIEVLYSDELEGLCVYGREGVDYRVENGNKVPIFPSALDSTWSRSYLYARTANTPASMDYDITLAIYADTSRTPAQNAEYEARYRQAMAEVSESVLNHEGYDPIGFFPAAPDNIGNAANNAWNEQVALFGLAVVGEIDMATFKTRKDAMVAKYQYVTDYYNEQLQIVKSQYDLGLR